VFRCGTSTIPMKPVRVERVDPKLLPRKPLVLQFTVNNEVGKISVWCTNIWKTTSFWPILQHLQDEKMFTLHFCSKDELKLNPASPHQMVSV